MKKVMSRINKTLFYGLLLLGIILLLLGIKQSLMLFSIGSFFGSWFLAWFLRRKGFPPESEFELLINIGLWFNIIGEFWIYYGFTYYDKILHFLMGVLITIIVYQYYLKKLKLQKDMIFFTVLGMFAIWEIYEYFIFIIFNYPTLGVIINGKVVMSALDDTFMDLIWGSIGSLIYLLFKKEDVLRKIKKIVNSKK